jgi:peroxiredoxin Q/BCP
MAQLRQDYQQFVERNAEIVVVGPDDQGAFQTYFSENELPFTGIPDPEHTVLKTYGQEVKLFKMGRMPAQALIDETGTVRYIHYGHEMSDIPPNEELLGLLDELSPLEA